MRERNFLIKPVSGLCNMKCEYCFYTDEMDNRKQASYGMMQDDVMEQVIKKTLAATEKTCTFLFQGGEPMLAGRAFYEKWLAYEKNTTRTRLRFRTPCKQTAAWLMRTGAAFGRKTNF